MDIFFVIKKSKIKKVFYKETRSNKPYCQLYVQDNRKEIKNIFIFSNVYEQFDDLDFKNDINYRITGRVINLFGNKQILSVSKIIPLCENNKLGSEKSHLKPMGVKN